MTLSMYYRSILTEQCISKRCNRRSASVTVMGGGVIEVLDQAVKVGREAHAAETLLLVPNATPLRIIRLSRLAQLFLVGVVTRAKDLLQHLLAANLNLSTNAAAKVNVQALRHLLPDHAFGALLDLCRPVFLRRIGVCNSRARIPVSEIFLARLRRVIRLDRVVQFVDGVQTRRLVTSASSRH